MSQKSPASVYMSISEEKGAAVSVQPDGDLKDAASKDTT